MESEIARIYRRKDRRKRELLSLKNRYFAIIYGSRLRGDSVRETHRRLYEATIRKPEYADKALLAMAMKLAKKAQKVPGEGGELAAALLGLLKKTKADQAAKRIINHDVGAEAEKEKMDAVESEIEGNRKEGKWFYLASSHDDCAKDHKEAQGRLYVDAEAPHEAIEYARARGLMTLQWVMGPPTWFVTRPNCRHYFAALTESEVRRKSLKRLKKKHKTHRKVGDWALQTPKSAAIEEYEDRLRMLRALRRERPSRELDAEILKTELLLKKWRSRK